MRPVGHKLFEKLLLAIWEAACAGRGREDGPQSRDGGHEWRAKKEERTRSERAAGAPPVRTLRLVHEITYELFSLVRTVRGDGRGVAAQENRIMPAPPPRSVTLHLSRLAAELATGDYIYFEELVVQTSGLLSVDEGELAEVRKHFAVARAEHIAALPSIPVPDYCWEPAGNAQKMFPGSFW